ncbi:MAG: D-N-carbamoylase [Candidatus Devosia phytovorans]|uniref:D-N-carbamoylase n=1 Tax=Candidatus Devosia phytovorans TaxID=3121372 RepID=A0AAJ6B290_9HYPH|nr:nitrilase-related carbon-nitrogen hydrolase [Devosia sp.]WEK05288.1 MAG: D-N-carbamoylase [Devosia sp.]
MLVAALQMGPAGASIAETTDRILALIDEAADAGVTLGVLPELALTPYFAAEVHSNLDAWVSEAENQAALATIMARGQKHNMSLVVPYAERSGGDLFNSMAFMHRGGNHAGTFRKMHIPGEIEPRPDAKMTILEKRYFKPGNLGFGVYDVGDIKIGGLICYDRRFPEAYRSLSINGADVIAVGYNTPVMAGNTLAQARKASDLAITAGAYYTGTTIIAAGKAGKENGVRFIGHSFVVSAEGKVLARAKSNHDEVVLAEIDLERQARVRERWAFERNRRPADYVLTEAR